MFEEGTLDLASGMGSGPKLLLFLNCGKIHREEKSTILTIMRVQNLTVFNIFTTGHRCPHSRVPEHFYRPKRKPRTHEGAPAHCPLP